jgi:TolA-binding protein
MVSWCKVSVLGVVLTLFLGCSGGQKPFQPASSGQADAKKVAAPETSVSAEGDLVVQLQQVRADYKRVLEVLHRWYLEHGWHEKSKWAANELRDLNRVHTYEYAAPQSDAVKLGKVDEARKASLQNIDIANFSEVDRIEQLQQIRTSYMQILKNLIQCYEDGGDSRKAGWARRELDDLIHVRQYPYLVEVDIQNTNLTPKDSIVEADKLYDEALKLFHDGKILPFMNLKRKLKEAQDKFTLLIKTYPTSDKIDDAAFYAGEISKEYFNDDVQAIRYYEMAMKWDPRTPHPVRFECAVIYDFRLHDRARAMAMYQRVLKEEADIDQTNTSFSASRLRELLKDTEQAEETPPAAEPNQSAPVNPK